MTCLLGWSAQSSLPFKGGKVRTLMLGWRDCLDGCRGDTVHMSEQAMSEAMAIARLLDTLDALGYIARHLHPPRLEELVATLGDRDAALREALADVVWPDQLGDHRAGRGGNACAPATDCVRRPVRPDGLRQAYRALRQVSRALEALYPLASVMPTVSHWFLASDDADGRPHARTDLPTGVMHAANDTSERGGFSVYVPEDYDPARAYPLVMALHGGAGHGRLFLWSWLREARGRGVILVAPTAIGDTWSLMEPHVDSAIWRGCWRRSRSAGMSTGRACC